MRAIAAMPHDLECVAKPSDQVDEHHLRLEAWSTGLRSLSGNVLQGLPLGLGLALELVPLSRAMLRRRLVPVRRPASGAEDPALLASG